MKKGGDTMNNVIKKVGIGAVTAALLTLSAVPSAFAATTVDSSGNGAFSNNNATVSNDCSSTVAQSANDWISNIISLMLGTGGNSASFNTGGSVIVASGNTSAS